MKHLLLLALLVSQPAYGQQGSHWVATWTTAQDLARQQPAARPAVPPAATPAPATPPRPIPPGMRGFENQTVRMIVRSSIGGNRVRIKLSSSFGSDPVNIGAAHIALRAKDSAIVPGTDRALTFSGKPECIIGDGMVITSDPVDLKVPALAELAVSLYLPGASGRPTTHGSALHTNYISKEGNFTGEAAIADAATSEAYFWLAGVDVMAPAEAGLIVALGDSITDGIRSTPDTDHTWPAFLAARLAARKDTANVGVANMGISGNKVLKDGAGVSAVARFDRDVLSQSGVKWVMLLEGINDIGTGRPGDPVTVDDLTGAYRQMIEEAHTHGIKVIGCTLTPFLGAPYRREPGEPIREGVNQWIRSSGAFDAVVDFDAAVRDASDPNKIRAEFDPGDHLHPNDKGYQAMADAIDLGIFAAKK
jgi:lysophospholipase L1-like esterase